MDRRQRLLPWLRAKVEAGEYRLIWINKDEQIFGIPWIHQNKETWSAEYSQLFKEWAIFTHSYRNGDPEDWTAWKTRVRTALNKLSYFDRIPEKDFTSEADIPYRAYRFVVGQNQNNARTDSSAKKRKSIPKGAQQCSPAHEFMNSSSNSTSPMAYNFPVYGNIPNIVESNDIPSPSAAQFGQTPFMDSYPPMSQSFTVVDSPLQASQASLIDSSPQGSQMSVMESSPQGSQMSVMESSPQTHYRALAAEFLLGSLDNNDRQELNPGRLSPGLASIDPGDFVTLDPIPSNEMSQYIFEPKLQYKIFYLNTVIDEGYLSDKGVHFYYGPKPNIPCDEYHEKIFGPIHLEQKEFPNLSLLTEIKKSVSPEKLEHLTEIQTELERGFLLKYHEGDIFAQRLCRTRMFVKSELFSENLRLDRRSDMATKLFDWAKFQEKLNMSPEVILTFAQEPSRNQLCHMELTHLEAKELQMKYFPAAAQPSLQFSDLDSMDKRLRNLKLNQPQ